MTVYSLLLFDLLQLFDLNPQCIMLLSTKLHLNLSKLTIL